ncbi:phenol hydroxylase subunit P4 [Pseudothauera rhizosphaerae]|uniref:Phenol hydroxylase n=1 Tax=Pseudothauera rhizosphaerae TaxID=2565932 RepID=A0A4S4ALQ2_9RHOO|nr:phenol hydroxylase subunit P4 [Pseudothauera rhizosphaerae]THF60372.1 phenol hydroxylase [Pseudothauera rhizosphaerae]
MPVAAVKEYVGVARDTVANYHGNQILYMCWDGHLMLAAPFSLLVSPEMKFGDVLTGMVAPILQVHPDAAHINWAEARWEKDDEPWTPDPEKSIRDNGLHHKDFLRFSTPGLKGYRGLGI